MDIFDLVVVIFLYIVPLIIPAVIVPLQLEKVSNKDASLRKIWVINLTTLILSAIYLYIANYLFPFIPYFPYFAFLLPYIAAAWGLIFRILFIRSRLKPEDIIINLGKSNSNFKTIFFILYLILFPLLIASNLFFVIVIDDKRDFFLVIMILHLIIGLFNIVLYGAGMLSNVYLTRDGFSRFWLDSLKWQNIKAYQWRSADDEKIELMLKARPEITLNIPLEHRQQVNNILKAEVGLELSSENFYRVPLITG